MNANFHLYPIVSAITTITPTYQNDSKTITKDHFQIGSFKICKNLNEIKQLHCQITKEGISYRPSTVSKLIAACAELSTSESLDYARKAFELFQEDDGANVTLFMYNSLIRGYSLSGLIDEAISLYIQMAASGIFPDNFTFPFALNACAKASALLEGVQLHGTIFKMGLDEDVFVGNSLIHFYAESGEICFGRKVFEKMIERNVVSWTSLFCGYGRAGSPREAVSLFLEMVEAGIRPNSVAMVCVISACGKLKDLELGERVCAHIGECGVKLNTHMVNSLVDMYMKCGSIGAAKRIFDECVDRNLVLYNTMISNYVHRGLPKEALAILDEMLQVGPRPDRVTLLSAISACAQLRDCIFGKWCHGYTLRNGLEGWNNISNAIIDMYMKCGKPEIACRVFDGMSNKTIVSWNSLIAGLIRNGDLGSACEIFNEMSESDLVSWNTMISGLVQESMFNEAMEFFRLMQTRGIKPDRVTMVEVASACGYLGALDLAKWIYTYILKNKIECDMLLGTALVDMFARCGDPQCAMQVFNNMESKDVSAWTAAIGAMAMEGNGEQAIVLFNEMVNQGVKPDSVAFANVLTACSHGGFVEKGQSLFGSMEMHGISPQIVHYGCIVDLLGRAGLLGEALDLVKSMPMEANEVIWGSLLAACRTHKNVEMAKFAAEKLIEVAPERTGIHVLLSNIYASVGKWADVAKVRLQMKEKGVQKMPGSSLIEINGAIHEFTSGDESHPENGHIRLMLQEIKWRLSDAGYAPDLSNVLLDVDEQEKEFLLSRHSEKLAMAFGLVGTGQGVTIRVVKNLRMCSDCHLFAKFISRLYDREIVIRDNNRYHFFREGSCSCCDYW